MTSRATLTCSVISDPEELERLGPAWLALLKRSGTNEPTLTPTWLLTWWRVFGPHEGRQLQTALFFEGERLVGLAPLLKRRHWYRPGIPFQRLEPLGAGESGADAVCSDYLSVIAEQGAETAVAQALAQALISDAFGHWDELVFPVMNGEGIFPTLLNEAINTVGIMASIETTGVAPYTSLPATWEAYLKSLSSSKRYAITRSLRDFDKWAGAAVEIKCAATPAELEEGKRILVALHHERWGTVGRTGVFCAPRFVDFHDRVMPKLLEEGSLELLWMSVRGEPIAALYNIVWNGKVYFYQSGRKVDVPQNVRPGVVAHAYAIRRAIDAGRREYDFLAGVSQYKMQFALATRPLVQIRAVRRSFVEQARRFADRGIAGARAMRDATRSVTGWFRNFQKQSRQEQPPASTSPRQCEEAIESK